jgi:DNA-binding response OmpR family regulator
MNNQYLFIYQFTHLYQILKELDQDLNFKIKDVSKEKNLNNEIKDLKNYLVITKKEISNIKKQFVLDKLPIKIFKLIEKLNIDFLKHQFNDQSQITIGNYNINLNSREMRSKNTKLKLTEKEVNTILYISKMNKPISIEELQTNVWGYQSDIETHTVETHIYRLRNKISKSFEDTNFIISKKNGYEIK